MSGYMPMNEGLGKAPPWKPPLSATQFWVLETGVVGMRTYNPMLKVAWPKPPGFVRFIKKEEYLKALGNSSEGKKLIPSTYVPPGEVVAGAKPIQKIVKITIPAGGNLTQEQLRTALQYRKDNNLSGGSPVQGLQQVKETGKNYLLIVGGIATIGLIFYSGIKSYQGYRSVKTAYGKVRDRVSGTISSVKKHIHDATA